MNKLNLAKRYFSTNDAAINDEAFNFSGVAKKGFKPHLIYAILSLTRVKVCEGKGKNLVATTYFSSENFTLKKDKLWDCLNRLNEPFLILVYVTKSEYRSYDVKLLEYPNSNRGIYIIIVRFDKLFDSEFRQRDFVFSNLYKTIFIFEDVSWSDVCLQFKTKNIIVSGGTDTKKHILSPIEYKFSIYLNGLGITTNDIINSFHNVSKEYIYPNSKKTTIKEIFDSNNDSNPNKNLDYTDSIKTIKDFEKEFNTENISYSESSTIGDNKNKEEQIPDKPEQNRSEDFTNKQSFENNKNVLPVDKLIFDLFKKKRYYHTSSSSNMKINKHFFYTNKFLIFSLGGISNP
jgi:hypothetical protein